MAELKVPALGESITEAIIGKWLKNVGDHVDVDEPIVDLETDKITVQLPSPGSGALSKQLFQEGDTVQVGDTVGEIDESAKGAAAPSKPAAPATKKSAPVAAAASVGAEPATNAALTPGQPAQEIQSRGGDGRLLSPSERREMRSGSGPTSRVPAPNKRAPTIPHPALSAATGDKHEDLVRMSPLRKRIAERLVQAQQSTASLTTFNEVDMSAVIELRTKFKEDFLKAHGVKLGFMSFFVRAAVEALKLFPGVNAEVRDQSIAYKKYYDLGIAVGTPKGLVVPVLRACDHLGFAEIESGIVDLAVRARDSKLTLADLTGGTFSVTNGGIYGSMMSTPLLNFPQTGILGMHNIVKRAVVVGDSVQVRPMMYIALTYDHRVVDGKEAVQFLTAIKERIEDPRRLLFGV